MSPWSAMFYNILAMGVIFPWTYLWAPGSLPGGQLVWGIILAMLFEIPIALVYVFLSTALPRSGGDYVFQSRVWGGGTAFAITMSGIVIWQFVWIALAGWLLSYLGFAPLFLGLGATLRKSDPGQHRRGVYHRSRHHDRQHPECLGRLCAAGFRLQELCQPPAMDGGVHGHRDHDHDCRVVCGATRPRSRQAECVLGGGRRQRPTITRVPSMPSKPRASI